jgi:hypothetical protein
VLALVIVFAADMCAMLALLMVASASRDPM